MTYQLQVPASVQYRNINTNPVIDIYTQQTPTAYVSISVYWYVSACVGMYQGVLVCISVCWYVSVCVGMYIDMYINYKIIYILPSLIWVYLDFGISFNSSMHISMYPHALICIHMYQCWCACANYMLSITL